MEAHKEKAYSDFRNYLNRVHTLCTWRYLGQIEGDVIKVLTGSLRFESVADFPRPSRIDIQAGPLVAGVVEVDAKYNAGIDIVMALVLGRPHNISNRLFQLEPSDRSECDLHLRQPWCDLINEAKVASLQITGGSRRTHIPDVAELNAALKTATNPFEDIHELLRAVGLPHQSSDYCFVEVSVTPIARFTYQPRDSITSDHRAALSLAVPNGLDIDALRLGWRTSYTSGVVDRDSVEGKNLRWTKGESVWITSHEIDIPDGGALHCYLSVAGHLQHERRINRHTLGNARLEVYELFDPKLKWLQSQLFERDYSKRNSRTFEEAVAYLFFFLGFSGMHFCDRLTSGPDGLAITVNGDIVVIECTTETFDSDKVEDLIDRADKVRDRAKASTLVEKKVLPVMVTLHGRTDDENWVKRTTELGAVLLGSDDLLRLLGRAQTQADCHLEVFDELCREIRKIDAFSNLMKFS